MLNAILIILGLLIIFVIFLLLKTQKQPHKDALGLMQQQIDGLRTQVSDSLNANSQLMNQRLSELTGSINQNLQALGQQMNSSQATVGTRLDAAAQVFGEVQKNLGSLSQATERVFEIGKDISGLQEILKAPKLRGVLGELFLGELLQKILPASHIKLQHKFKNGDTVDAAVSIGQQILSIDSKFPLENFRRIISGTNEEEKRKARRSFINDVKKHIDSIAGKYILPDEGTFDFALMYIPAENVYYELIIKDEAESDADQSLNSYALNKRVIPVSPNVLYIFIQAVINGLKGMRVEKHVRQIIEHLARLSGDIGRFKEDFEVLGRHVVNLKNKYEEAEKKLGNFEDKLLNVCKVDKENGVLQGDE